MSTYIIYQEYISINVAKKAKINPNLVENSEWI